LEVNDIPDCTNEAPIEINLEEYGTGLEFGSQTASHHLKVSSFLQRSINNNNSEKCLFRCLNQRNAVHPCTFPFFA
jgi:hypothetical protein